MTASDVKRNREWLEKRALVLAGRLPDGDYYADGGNCVERVTGKRITCGTHWDACLVMIAANRRSAAA